MTYDWPEKRRVEVRVFNSWKESAQRLVAMAGPDVDQPIRTADAPPPHVLLVGYSWLGQKVVEELAHISHYAYSKKVKVTLVDPEGDSVKAQLFSTYPALNSSADGKTWQDAKPLIPLIEVNVIQAPCDGVFLDHVLSDGPPVSIAYICAHDAETALLSARGLALQSPQAKFRIILSADNGLQEFNSFNLIDDRIKFFDPIVEGLRVERGESFLGQFAEREAAIVHFHFDAVHQGNLNLPQPLEEYAKTLRNTSADAVTRAHWIELDGKWRKDTTELLTITWN